MKNKNYKYKELTPLWIAVFVDILGFSIILPFLPFFMQEFSASPIVIGLLLSSNAIFGFIFGPILSKLSDKYGRKPLLLISQAGTLAGFIILTFSNNLLLLFIARIVDGIFGGNFPISKAVIGDVVPPKERPKQMTNIGITFTLAFLIGPTIGGLLSPFGVMGPGLVASGLALFTLIFTLTKLKETLPLKVCDDGLIEAANTTEDKVIIEFTKQKCEDSDPKEQFVIDKTPIWKNNRAILLLTQYSILAIAAGVIQSTFSLFGAIRLNLDPPTIGLLLSAMGLFQVFFRALLFNRIRNYLGDPKTALLGLGSYVIAYFLLSFVVDVWMLVLVLFYISFSGATSRGITIGFTSRSVDFRNQGKIMGITSSIDSISQIIGPLLGGFLLSLTNNLLYGLVLSLISIVPFLLGFQVLKFGYDGRKEPVIETIGIAERVEKNPTV